MEHPAIARRWPYGIARQTSALQERILGLLGASLWQQTAQVLLAPHRGRRLLATTQRWVSYLPW